VSTSPTGRMERVAAVPHRHLVGLVEQAHGVDAEVRAHARDLAAVGDDGDAGGLGVGRPLELLEHEVGLATEVGHTGAGLDGRLGDGGVVPVGHGAEERGDGLEEGDEGRIALSTTGHAPGRSRARGGEREVLLPVGDQILMTARQTSPVDRLVARATMRSVPRPSLV
jgi:hypothetical protein